MVARDLLAWIVVGTAAVTAACADRTPVAEPTQASSIAPNARPLPPFDPPTPHAEAMNTEFYRGSKAEEAAEFASFAKQINEIQLDQTSSRGQQVQRGFHAKAHGCVTGWFQLFPDRDPRTRFGVFADGAGPWPVWIRFSNGVGWRTDDDSLDARGMAVKLMGVSGARLDEEQQTQDFLMTNAPTPVGRDAVEFMKFAHANSTSQLRSMLFMSAHLHTAGPALLGTNPIESTVATQYWSGGAFHLGAHQAIKFTAKPCSFDHARAPLGSGDDRLRADLIAAANDGFCFNFYVQFQSDPYRTPIEDASHEWSEADAPLVPVGKIVVPPQHIDDPRRDELCTSFSFSPWHGIVAHQPMGHINRARRFVYASSRAYRKGGHEPHDFEGFAPQSP